MPRDLEPVSRRAMATLSRPWVLAILVLHLGVLGIPLYLQTDYSWRVRVFICLGSVLYTVFAVAVIWSGCRYLWTAWQTLAV